jgi:hypothetical protein
MTEKNESVGGCGGGERSRTGRVRVKGVPSSDMTEPHV